MNANENPNRGFDAMVIERLWRDEPPPSPTNTLQTCISQLRRYLTCGV